jgi:hypothetical protein
MRRTITAALLAGLTLFAAACGPGKSTAVPKLDPSASAAAHQAEQRGQAILEHCTPNGKAMLGPVFHNTATALTYLQVYKFFKSKDHRATVWACAEKQAGAAQIPGAANPKTAIENCFAKSDAATGAVQHPIRSAHHAKQTAQALLNAAAVCAGKFA